MNRIGTIALFCAVSLAGLSAANAAATPTSSTGASDDVGLQEIVVTAQKRSERVQDVPVSVAVVDSKQLEQQNIATTSDLVQAVPTLTVTNFGVFQIRSLGTQGFGKSAEQSVSVVVDGVAMPRPQAYELGNAVFDLDHVEVLAGPQGTLFGKNSSAGVINIVTNTPRLGQLEANAHLDVGNHDYMNANGILNIPLAESAAIRLAVHHTTKGDVVYNTLFHLWDRSADDGIRGRILWQPTDDLTVNLIGDYQKLWSNGVDGIADFAGVAIFRSVPPGSRLEATLASCGIVASPNNNRECADSTYVPGVNRGNVYGAERRGGSLQVDWSFLGGYTLTSISAFRDDVTGDFGVDGDFGGGFADTLPTNILQRNLFPTSLRMFSEEARIASPAKDRINFVAGLYFSKIQSHDHIDQAGAFGLDLGGAEFRRVDDVKSDAKNYGAFGQVNFEATDALRFLVGARVTHDNLSTFSINSFPDAVPAGTFLYTANTGFFSLFPINTCTLAGGNPDVPGSCPAGTSLNDPAKLSTTGYTWKVGAQYRFNPLTMAYATISKGYKGPFINDQASYPISASQLVIRPEPPLAYELGLKSTIFDRLNVAAALFYDKTNDFQTTIYVPPTPPALTSNFIQGNAPYAVSRGLEMSLNGNVTRNFSLNGGLLYDDAHFNNGFLVNCSAGPCPARRQLPYAPKWKANLSGEYRFGFTDWAQGFVQSDLSFSGRYPYSSTPAPDGLESEARYVLGARAGVRFKDDKFEISVFCRNCADRRYPLVVTPDGFASSDGGTFGGATSYVQFLGLSSYRVFGVTLNAKW